MKAIGFWSGSRIMTDVEAEAVLKLMRGNGRHLDDGAEEMNEEIQRSCISKTCIRPV